MKSKTKRPTKEESKWYDEYRSMMIAHDIQPRSLELWLDNKRAVQSRPKKEAPS